MYWECMDIEEKLTPTQKELFHSTKIYSVYHNLGNAPGREFGSIFSQIAWLHDNSSLKKIKNVLIKIASDKYEEPQS